MAANLARRIVRAYGHDGAQEEINRIGGKNNHHLPKVPGCEAGDKDDPGPRGTLAVKASNEHTAPMQRREIPHEHCREITSGAELLIRYKRYNNLVYFVFPRLTMRSLKFPESQRAKSLENSNFQGRRIFLHQVTQYLVV